MLVNIQQFVNEYNCFLQSEVWIQALKSIKNSSMTSLGFEPFDLKRLTTFPKTQRLRNILSTILQHSIKLEQPSFGSTASLQSNCRTAIEEEMFDRFSALAYSGILSGNQYHQGPMGVRDMGSVWSVTRTTEDHH